MLGQFIVLLCKLRKYFQHLCGTDPHPVQFRAKKYKLEQRFMEKKDFMEMMQVNLKKRFYHTWGKVYVVKKRNAIHFIYLPVDNSIL